MKFKNAVLIGTSAFLLAVGAYATSANASGEEPPPNPPWVNADGTINEDTLPDKEYVVGPNGETLTDKNGNPVMVDTQPGDPEEDAADSARLQEEEEGKRWLETEESGEVTEVLEVEPSTPAAP